MVLDEKVVPDKASAGPDARGCPGAGGYDYDARGGEEGFNGLVAPQVTSVYREISPEQGDRRRRRMHRILLLAPAGGRVNIRVCVWHAILQILFDFLE